MAALNLRNLATVPSLDELQKYSVNRAGQLEGVRSSLYDFQAYAQAGQTELNFFQVPVGQASKTLADTNMQTAGSLPNPQNFLVTNIQIYFYFTASDLAVFGAQAAAEQVNDVYDVMKSGYLEFFIGSKNYVQEGPLGRFPPRTGLILSAALTDQTTAAAASQSRIAYANFGGAPYDLTPPILLTPTQNFRVSTKWPTAVAISAIARIGCVMEGVLYRLSQ
jgi:hypothetical protein